MTLTRTDSVVRRALRAVCVACCIAAPSVADDEPRRDVAPPVHPALHVHSVELCPPGRHVETDHTRAPKLEIAPNHRSVALVHYARPRNKMTVFDPVVRVITLDGHRVNEYPVMARKRPDVCFAHDGQRLFAWSIFGHAELALDLATMRMQGGHPIFAFQNSIYWLSETPHRYYAVPIKAGTGTADGAAPPEDLEYTFGEGHDDYVILDHESEERMLFEAAALFDGSPDLWIAPGGVIVMRGVDVTSGAVCWRIFVIRNTSIVPVATIPSGTSDLASSWRVDDDGTVWLPRVDADGTASVHRIPTDGSKRRDPIQLPDLVDDATRRVVYWATQASDRSSCTLLCDQTGAGRTFHRLSADGALEPNVLSVARSHHPVATVTRDGETYLVCRVGSHRTTTQTLEITRLRDRAVATIPLPPGATRHRASGWLIAAGPVPERVHLIDPARWTLDDDDFTPPAPPE